MALIAVLLFFVPEETDLLPSYSWTEADVALKEEMEQLLAQPVDLNRASVEDLLAIPWLEPFLAHAIIRTRDSMGGFCDMSELRLVPGMNSDVLQSLFDVVTIRRSTRTWTSSAMFRAAVDSFAGPGHRPTLFTRAQVSNGPWQAAGVVEKDRCEPNWFDFVGGSLQFRSSRFRAVLGDLTLGSGRGLVLSSASRRGSSWLNEKAWAKGQLEFPVSATEGSGLRGFGLEASKTGLGALGWVATSARDARLNPDGSVERVRTDGRHVDSAARAEKGTLTEHSAGAVVRVRWQKVQLGASGMRVAYNRPFVARDSACAFFGRDLSVGGVSLEWLTQGYAVGAELAATSSRRVAGALEVSGNRRGVAAGMNLRGRGHGFFSPHGRWSSTTSSGGRLDGSVRFGYRARGFGANCRANSYRDFEFDSLPARLAVDIGQRVGWLRARLELGRVFRAGEGRCHSSQLKFELEPETGGRVILVLADEHPELRPGRGLAVGLMAFLRRRWFSGGVSVARFVITGSGITMSAVEPGVMRAGGSFHTACTGWRTAAGAGISMVGPGRLGLKVGCTWSPGPNLDAAAQLELAADGD